MKMAGKHRGRSKADVGAGLTAGLFLTFARLKNVLQSSVSERNLHRRYSLTLVGGCHSNSVKLVLQL